MWFFNSYLQIIVDVSSHEYSTYIARITFVSIFILYLAHLMKLFDLKSKLNHDDLSHTFVLYSSLTVNLWLHLLYLKYVTLPLLASHLIVFFLGLEFIAFILVVPENISFRFFSYWCVNIATLIFINTWKSNSKYSNDTNITFWEMTLVYFVSTSFKENFTADVWFSKVSYCIGTHTISWENSSIIKTFWFSFQTWFFDNMQITSEWW